MSSRPELRLPSPSAVFDNDGGDGLLFAPHRALITTTSDFASSHLSSMTKKRLNVSNDGRPSPATLNDGATYPVAGSSTCIITSNVARSSSKSIGTSIEKRKVPSSKKEAVNPKSVQYDIAGKSRATGDVKLRKSVKTESSELDPFAHAGQTSSSQFDSSSSRKRRRPQDTDNTVTAPRLGRMKQEHGIEDQWDGDASFEACQTQLRQQSDTVVRQQMQMDMKANQRQPHRGKRHSLDIPDKTTLKTSQPANASSGKQTKKAKIDPMYKRPARERTHCPKAVMDRLDRAMSQRMLMIELVPCANAPNQVDDFKVLGSTGNVYTVTIGNFPSCDCPDYMKGNSPCKHIIFVFLKVLKVPEHSSVWYQKGLTPAEVQWVFQQAPPAPSGSVAVHSSVRNAYLRAAGILPEQATSTSGDNGQFNGKRIDAIGEDCPICYEEMTQQDDVDNKLVYDDSLGGCGRPSHAECFKIWAATAKKNGRVTCVWCRNEWPTGTAGGKGKGKMNEPSYDSMGYLNMASIAGLRRTRDTSTYHRGWRYRNDDSEED
ncbi:hypothetical protein I314_05583 [Cryptococcus bacillisporus CA1873]|uniref:SWIM-type domain-containing protein n=1 Tax=Cryptococcus bacillisporus CA1873 TaxID=1296111 RepID=A0ABR5B577_CRYGA|nr:hypothetical protein I314_05583 [Cryptococcus bacillisporus CA1873]|eukprot:KIR58743.1 hypothetical protein I314_05583 [Cryptococcus gattii CA1873]